ncbi:MAG: DUF4214 domain-containing protein [Acidimicrobiia bacterium]|nr:DUF4214 domain-containing protein [Acidimicrobiia bacterium]
MRIRVLQLLALALVGTLIPLVTPAPTGAEEAVGSLPTAEDFVTQQYEDFLSRPPDTAGLAYWTEQVEGGLEPSALVESLALSNEFEGTIAPVVRLYYAHFRRPPDYDGMTHWAQVARNGWSMEKISEEFVRSQEFRDTYGSLSDAAYVDQVYSNVLGRSADAGGSTYWAGQLAHGMTRGELMVAFAESPEYRNLIGARVLATMLYVGMLRRAPEGSGLDYWAGVIGGGTPYRNVIAGFLGAQEYHGRMDRIYDEVHPLTGIPTRSAARRPALAVKIDNVDRARPQTSVDRADVVYEEMVEGQLTRLIAVFHSDLPDVVGPVRSVRTTDIDILAQLNTPLLAASGANAGVLAAVANADLVNVNALVAGGAYYRDTRRRAPHNMYARPAALYQAANGHGGQPSLLFHYRPPRTRAGGGVPAPGVGIEFGRADIDFTWSSRARGWLRSQNGEPHVTAAGVRLAPANVVVLETPYGVSSIDANSPEAHTTGSGPAYVFTAGEVVVGTWSRSAATDRIRLTDGDGDEIGLTRGQTFVELAPPGSIRLR